MKFTMRTITTSFIFLTFIVICNPIFAQFTEKEFDVDLWANGLPNTNGIDHTPFDDNIQNYKPSLRIFLPSKERATGRVIIACPGGAYGGLAYRHEGYDWVLQPIGHCLCCPEISYAKRKSRGSIL